LRKPGEAFDAALEEFCVDARRLGWGEGTVRSARSGIRQFLFAVEDAGITTVAGITPGVVSAAVTVVAQRWHGGLSNWLFAVRAFLRHLGVTGYRAGFGIRQAGLGLQAEMVGGARVWVLPNPSGLNAHYSPTKLAIEFAKLRIATGLPDRSGVLGDGTFGGPSC
jgi:hypothetical protein